MRGLINPFVLSKTPRVVASLLGYFHQAEPRQTRSNKQNPGCIFRCCGNRALKTRRYGPFLLDLALYLRVLRARGWWQPVPHPVKIPSLACGMGLSPDGVSCALHLSGCSSRGSPVSLVLDGTFSGCGGNRHDGDPVIARPPPLAGSCREATGVAKPAAGHKGPPKPMRILVSAGLRDIRECAPNVTRLRDHRMPCATMALATLTKPAALAPSIRSPSWPYSLAAARESATMVSMMFLSLASTSSKDHDRR